MKFLTECIFLIQFIHIDTILSFKKKIRIFQRTCKPLRNLDYIIDSEFSIAIRIHI